MTFPRQPPIGADAPSPLDWGACLAMHAGWLRKVILARTGEPQAVEDVLQQVAVAAIEQKAALTDPEKAAPWLHRLAVVHSARYRRKLGRERKAMRTVAQRKLHLDNGYVTDTLVWLQAKEQRQQTREALARLSGADAEILLLKYGEGWSYKQIAQRLGISEKAVDGRIMRARARLREKLLKGGINEGES